MKKAAVLSLTLLLAGCFGTVPVCPPIPPAKQQLELKVDPELLKPPPKLEKL